MKLLNLLILLFFTSNLIAQEAQEVDTIMAEKILIETHQILDVSIISCSGYRGCGSAPMYRCNFGRIYSKEENEAGLNLKPSN